jgi:hypothetical protein
VGQFCGWSEFLRRAFASNRGPFGFNLYASLNPRCIVQKAAPLPIFREFAQPALNRIAMKVPQFLQKLCMIPDIEIVVALLPEVFRRIDQSARYSLL